MRNLIRAEFTQLHTLRKTYGVLALGLLLVTGLTIGDFSEVGTKNLVTFDDMRAVVIRDAGMVIAMVFAIFAASRVGGEYRNGTIVQRAMASPRRGRMMTAKLITYTALAALTG